MFATSLAYISWALPRTNQQLVYWSFHRDQERTLLRHRHHLCHRAHLGEENAKEFIFRHGKRPRGSADVNAVVVLNHHLAPLPCSFCDIGWPPHGSFTLQLLAGFSVCLAQVRVCVDGASITCSAHLGATI